jgi:hypothetical protein
MEITKKTEKNLFMLDLIALARIPITSTCLDAKPSGKRCFYSTALCVRSGKSVGAGRQIDIPEVQGQTIAT